MKNTMHGQHNQHNVLREAARVNDNSQEREEKSVAEFPGAPSLRLISPEAISQQAYGKWESAGKPAGDGIAFWLEAEKELTAEDGDNWGRGNSQDADRHSEIRHPHSLKL